MTTSPSAGLIDEKSRSLSRSMKECACTLENLRKRWGRNESLSGDDELFKSLETISSSLSKIKEELSNIGALVGENVDDQEETLPDTVVMTFREYFILQTVFSLYTMNATKDTEKK